MLFTKASCAMIRRLLGLACICMSAAHSNWMEQKERSLLLSSSARQGNAVETGRRRKQALFVDKDQNDPSSNLEPGTIAFWALDRLKGERASRKMVFNQSTCHPSSDDPGIELEFPSCLRDLKPIKMDESEFVTSLNKDQFKIPIFPERGSTIFA